MKKKVIKLTEQQLKQIIENTINENHSLYKSLSISPRTLKLTGEYNLNDVIMEMEEIIKQLNAWKKVRANSVRQVGSGQWVPVQY